MKSPIIATISLFFALSSIPTASIQAQTIAQKDPYSFSQKSDNEKVLVNSDTPNYPSRKIAFLAKGDRVGNGFSLRDGGEVVGLISNYFGNDPGKSATSKHRGGNG